MVSQQIVFRVHDKSLRMLWSPPMASESVMSEKQLNLVLRPQSNRTFFSDDSIESWLSSVGFFSGSFSTHTLSNVEIDVLLQRINLQDSKREMMTRFLKAVSPDLVSKPSLRNFFSSIRQERVVVEGSLLSDGESMSRMIELAALNQQELALQPHDFTAAYEDEQVVDFYRSFVEATDYVSNSNYLTEELRNFDIKFVLNLFQVQMDFESEQSVLKVLEVSSRLLRLYDNEFLIGLISYLFSCVEEVFGPAILKLTADKRVAALRAKMADPQITSCQIGTRVASYFYWKGLQGIQQPASDEEF